MLVALLCLGYGIYLVLKGLELEDTYHRKIKFGVTNPPRFAGVLHLAVGFILVFASVVVASLLQSR